jgi:hypothetical protein
LLKKGDASLNQNAPQLYPIAALMLHPITDKLARQAMNTAIKKEPFKLLFYRSSTHGQADLPISGLE